MTWRYRHVVQAQRAVLRMGDAGLLGIFASEADGIIADISGPRSPVASRLQAAVQAAPAAHVAAGHPVHGRAALPGSRREQALASAAAWDLAAQMGREAVWIAHEIADVTGQLDRTSSSAYQGAGDSAAPVMIDRTG
ncbi:MAG: hypothetical protein IPP98_06815 [Gemmatimonadetes bacterium]|nr:hypothetical protein [Gemmatimonadota bacterium]